MRFSIGRPQLIFDLSYTSHDSEQLEEYVQRYMEENSFGDRGVDWRFHGSNKMEIMGRIRVVVVSEQLEVMLKMVLGID